MDSFYYRRFTDCSQEWLSLCDLAEAFIYLNRRDMLRHVIATLKAYSLNCCFDIAANEATTATRSKFKVDVTELLDCLKYMDNQRLEANAMLHEIPHLGLWHRFWRKWAIRL